MSLFFCRFSCWNGRFFVLRPYLFYFGWFFGFILLPLFYFFAQPHKSLSVQFIWQLNDLVSVLYERFWDRIVAVDLVHTVQASLAMLAWHWKARLGGLAWFVVSIVRHHQVSRVVPLLATLVFIGSFCLTKILLIVIAGVSALFRFTFVGLANWAIFLHSRRIILPYLATKTTATYAVKRVTVALLVTVRELTFSGQVLARQSLFLAEWVSVLVLIPQAARFWPRCYLITLYFDA